MYRRNCVTRVRRLGAAAPRRRRFVRSSKIRARSSRVSSEVASLVRRTETKLR